MAESPYLFFRSVLRICSYFNPRTPVGCDRMSRLPRVVPRYFNPRTPVGCDHTAGKAFAFRHISIHAPQWGATVCSNQYSTSKPFQSTHPSGVRPPCSRVPAAPCNFNPRTPVGCDRGCRPRAALPYHFNPRTPVGCDGVTCSISR